MGEGPEILASQALERLALSERCLARAQEPSCHVQEQLRLLSRAAGNLDDVFAGLLAERARCQLDPSRALELDRATRTVRQRARSLLHQQYRIWRGEVSRRLEERGIALAGAKGISANQQRAARSYFAASIFPALTPLAIDQRHPLPPAARDLSPQPHSPVHLELEMTAAPVVERMLASTLTLGSAEVYRVPGPLQLSDLAALDFEVCSGWDARDEKLERLSG